MLATLPEGPWPEGELSPDDVLAYCNTLPRRRSKKARSLNAGMSGAQVLALEDESGQGSIFKMFSSAEEMLQDVASLEVIASSARRPLQRRRRRRRRRQQQIK